jgi:pimeloyl-ACP methyl ester carboxylesterase
MNLESRYRRATLFAVAFILMAGATARAQLTLRPCGQAGIRAQCGTLRVPEDPVARDGRQLSLHVVVIPRTDARRAREPLFVLKGGPGEAATADAEDTIEMFGTVRADRDLVLLDQRGTGDSNRLDCVVADRSFLVPKDADGCLARLAGRADLRLYGTVNFVQDLEAARSALGYEQISLYGGSYGTRAAYFYAKRYPTRVRSVVLVGPAPPTMPLLDSFEQDGELTLKALVDDCASDRPCSNAFPTFASDLQKVRSELTDSFHVLGLQFLLYSSTTSRVIPFLVSEAAAGRREPLERSILAMRDRFVNQLSIGLHLSIMCSEELHRTSVSVEPDKPTALRSEYGAACRGWPPADVLADYRSTNRIDTRALVIVGERDPVTSPRWARVMADQFSRPQVVLIPKEGHIFDGAMLHCIAILTTDFLDGAEVEDSCVARQPTRPFVLRPR